jgi:hypothetical protein
MIKRLLISLAVALGLVATPLVAAEAAATPQNITLSPSSTELSAPPGGSDSGTVSVINGGSDAFNVKVYADGYHVTGLSYDPSFSPLPGKTDPSAWVHLASPTTTTIQAGQTDTFPYSLNVPAGTAPGGYYAVIFAETLPSSSVGVTSHSRVGNILYITVQGNVVQAGTLKPVSSSSFILGSSLPLSTLVENTGGLHFVASVQLKLINPITNKTTYSASLDRYVLPQTTRQISVTATPNSPIGIYEEEVSAQILGQTQTLPSRWVVVVHPIVLIVVPIIIVLVVIYFRLPKQRGDQKAKRKAGGK